MDTGYWERRYVGGFLWKLDDLSHAFWIWTGSDGLWLALTIWIELYLQYHAQRRVCMSQRVQLDRTTGVPSTSCATIRRLVDIRSGEASL
jgi:hypothetical protein